MNSQRKERKDEHIQNYLKSENVTSTLFDDVYLEHVALSDISLDMVDTSIEFLGKRISMPFMINAITGGGESSADINEDLSSICESLNIPMAVGSEAIALSEPDSVESFALIKEKDIVRIGNLGCERKYEDFTFARDLINADAIQLHLNMAQELVMKEGDRSFVGVSQLVEKLANEFTYPLIVKETGCGISKKVAQNLYNMGVRYIDVAGKGGTNFIEIEDLRDFETDFSEIYDWGIPTAKSIIDTRSVSDDIFIIASGGLKDAMDIVKSLVLGANMAAMSGEVLKYLLHGGYDACENFLRELNHKIKIIMALLGVTSIEELKKVDYKLTGKLKDLVYVN